MAVEIEILHRCIIGSNNRKQHRLLCDFDRESLGQHVRLLIERCNGLLFLLALVMEIGGDVAVDLGAASKICSPFR